MNHHTRNKNNFLLYQNWVTSTRQNTSKNKSNPIECSGMTEAFALWSGWRSVWAPVFWPVTTGVSTPVRRVQAAVHCLHWLTVVSAY